MRAQLVDFIALVITGCVILALLFVGLDFYHAHSRQVQGAAGALMVALVVRSVLRRRWLQRMGCWLEYIHETPRPDTAFDLTITYRFNEQEVTFFGHTASRERAKTLALPPLGSWSQFFPSWVWHKRTFLLKTLAYQYELEWIHSAPYPIGDGGGSRSMALDQNPVVADAVKGVNSPADYSWKIVREDPSDYKGRSLIYEEAGRRLVAYGEISGVAEFDWIGVDSVLSTWTEPAV